MSSTLNGMFKVSSRVKNHNFSKFAIFKWLNRANQELSFKKNSRKKCFFLCRLMERKSFFYGANYFNDRWQVLSYLIRMSLLNRANHAIWQKSWSTSVVISSPVIRRQNSFSTVFSKWKSGQVEGTFQTPSRQPVNQLGRNLANLLSDSFSKKPCLRILISFFVFELE